MKFTIPDRSPGASFSRLRFATELPTTNATADKLSSILAKRSNGVLEYRAATNCIRCAGLRMGQVVRSGDGLCRFPRLTLGLVRELVRAL
jgi:hypothetical protein